MAELLYEQYEKGALNPAAIISHFTDENEHREVAGLFHTRIKELSGIKEQEKALKETVIRVKTHSIDDMARKLEPTDIEGLQRLMEAKRRLLRPGELHISIN